MDAKLVKRIVTTVAIVAFMAWLVWSILIVIGTGEAQSADIGRPIEDAITHTTCDIYDEGGGMVTIYGGDGRIWKADPFEVGAMTSLSSPESPE